MALDNQTLKRLNAAVKALTATGQEISGKSKELMTLLYAITQGFINVEGNLSETLGALSEGKFEQKNIRPYLKSLGVADEIIEDILDKRKELDKLDDERILQAKSYHKLLDLIYGLEEDRYNLAEKTYSAFEQLSNQINNEKRLLRSTGIELGNQVDLVQKRISAQKELNNLFQHELLSTGELMDNINNIESVIDNITDTKFELEGIGTVDPAQAVKSIHEISAEQIKSIDLEDQIRRKKLKEFAAFSSGQKFLDVESGELFNAKGVKLTGAALASSMKQIEDMSSQYEHIIDQINNQGDLTEDQKSSLSDIEQILLRQAAASKSDLVTYKSKLDVVQKHLDLVMKFRPELLAVRESTYAVIDSMDGLFDVLPNGVRGVLGVDAAMEGLKETTDKAIKKFSTSLLETGKISKSVGASLAVWRTGIVAAINPLTALVGIMAGLFALTRQQEAKWEKISNQMGISLSQAKALSSANGKVLRSMDNQFIRSQELLDIQEQYIRSTEDVAGAMSKGTIQTLTDLAEIGKVMGYSAEQSYGMYEAFQKMGADDELSKKLQLELGYMSEMAGLSPDIIANELLDNADTLATYFAGMPEQAARAVLQIRRMGLSLKDASDIAGRMLDLEGFMTDMFELSAMGGPDFSEAFELGIRGDIEGMTESLLNSIGTLSEFENMDFLQRQKLAKTIGMTTGELSKTLMLREKMVGLTADEQKYLEANLDNFGNIQDMDMQAIKDRMAQQKATDRLAVAWEKIKGTLIKALGPAVEAFADTLDGISPILDVVIGAFKVLGGVIKVAATILKGILKPLQWIGDAVGWIIDQFSGVNAEIGGVKMSMAGGLNLVESIGTGIGGWYLVLKPILGGVSKLTGLFGKTLSMTGAVKSGIGSIFSTITGWMGSMSLPKGGILSKIFGKAPAGEVAKAQGVAGGFISKLKAMIPKGGIFSNVFGTASLGGIKDKMLKNVDDIVKGIKSKIPSLNIFGKIKGILPDIKIPKLSGIFTKLRGMIPNINIFDKIKGVMPSIKMPKFTGMFDKIRGMIPKINVFKGITGKVPKVGVPKFSGLFDKIRGMIPNINLFKGIRGIKPDVKVPKFSGLFSKIRAMIPSVNIFEKMRGYMPKITIPKFGGIFDKIRGMIPNINIFKGISGKIPKVGMPKFGGIFSKIRGMIPSINIFKGISGKIPKIKLPKFGGIFSKIRGMIPSINIFKGISGKIPKIKLPKFGGIFSKIRGMIPNINIFEKISGTTKGLFDKIMGKAPMNKIRGLGSAFTGMMSKIKAKLPTGGLLGKAVGEVPEKKMGGFFSKFSGLISKITSKLPGKGFLSSLMGGTKGATAMPTVDTTGVEKVGGGLADKFKKLFSKGKGIIKSGLSSLGKLLKSGFKVIKNIMGEVVSMVGNMIKTIGSAIGKTIKSILSGIGDGLSSFGPKAIKGAAALAILSGSLWVTSKALKNFADVSWEDIGKAGASLTGLTIAAMMLGKGSGQMILGAAGIAAMAVALIPLTDALLKFNTIEWGALAKAGTSLIGLGIAGAVLGSMAPSMILAAAGLGALGLALIPAAYAFEKFNEVEWGSLLKAGSAVLGFSILASAISPLAPLLLAAAGGLAAFGAAIIPLATGLKLFGSIDYDGIKSGVGTIAKALIVLGGTSSILVAIGPILGSSAIAIVGFAAAVGLAATLISGLHLDFENLAGSLKAIENVDGDRLAGVGVGLKQLGAGFLALGSGNILNGIANLFGGDPFKKLVQLAEISGPLDIAAKAIGFLSESLIRLSEALETIDLRKLSEFKDFKGIASKVGIGFTMQRGGDVAGGEPSPFATAQDKVVPEVLPPSPEATGQNVTVRDRQVQANEGAPLDPVEKAIQDSISSNGNRRIEQLLTQMIRVIQDMNSRPLVFEFDDGTVRHLRNKTKAMNNNR